MSYLDERRALKLKDKATSGEKKEATKKRKDFYDLALATKKPQVCENCKKDLSKSMVINPRAFIAHILPKSEKSGVPSVAEHPLNFWYACSTCHDDYDRKGEVFVLAMPVFHLLRQRVLKFYDKIEPKERRRVPEYFRP